MAATSPAPGKVITPAAAHPESSAAAAPPTRFHFMSYLLGLVTAVTLVGSVVFVLRRPEPPPIQLQPPPTPAPSPTPLPTATPAPIVVFVSGAVAAPGAYVLPPGARIGDALAAAGGLLAEADPALVNQAQPIYDGAQVHVPPAAAVMPEAVRADGPPIGLSGILPTPTPAAVSSGASSLAPGALVNVNTATLAELETLPGIGASRAQAIVDNRPYQTVDDLNRVPGIGDATLSRLRPLVTVQ
jgi:competence protein ComEA